jgi:hypothetical protein
MQQCPRRCFERAIGTAKVTPVEVVTDQAATYPAVLEELLPAAWHRTERYANNRVEADHGRLKARLRPMRGLRRDGNARVILAGHAFVQNVRRGHYELATEGPANRRLGCCVRRTGPGDLIPKRRVAASACPRSAQRNSAALSRCADSRSGDVMLDGVTPRTNGGCSFFQGRPQGGGRSGAGAGRGSSTWWAGRARRAWSGHRRFGWAVGGPPPAPGRPARAACGSSGG